MIKAAKSSFLILTMDLMNMCNVKGVQWQSHWELSPTLQFPSPLRILTSFSSLFWFSGPQLCPQKTHFEVQQAADFGKNQDYPLYCTCPAPHWRQSLQLTGIQEIGAFGSLGARYFSQELKPEFKGEWLIRRTQTWLFCPHLTFIYHKSDS